MFPPTQARNDFWRTVLQLGGQRRAMVATSLHLGRTTVEETLSMRNEGLGQSIKSTLT